MVDSYSAESARGYTAPGFEDVRSALEQSAEAHREVGCAAAAYVGGEKVVDLCWGSADGRPWDDETLVVIASATKGVVALCAQVLYDRGLLDVEAPVIEYWPEYGAEGKRSTLVKHFLNHTAGVLTFPDYWQVIDPEGPGLTDWDVMTAQLAAAPPSWQPGSRCMYHGITYGYLVGELIRRIDGRSVGRFLAEEVAAPLGLDLFIGTPESVLPRVASMLPMSAPAFDELPDDERQYWQRAEAELRDAREAVRSGDVLSMRALPWSSMFRHPDLEVDLTNRDIVAMWNSPRVRTAELPAGNGITSARHLARMYAVLACGGEVDGVRLLSPESIARFRRAEDEWNQPDPPPWYLGYHPLAPIGFAIRGASASSFGHAGGGGHIGFCDPDNALSFAFVKNQTGMPSGTGTELAATIFDCIHHATLTDGRHLGP